MSIADDLTYNRAMRLLLAAVLLAGRLRAADAGGETRAVPGDGGQSERPPPGPARVVLTASNIAIMDKVQFETGKAELMSASHALLDEVAKMLKDNPQVELISVEGHTDSTGWPTSIASCRNSARSRSRSTCRAKASRPHAWSRRASVPIARSPTTRPIRPRSEPPRRVQHPQAGSEESAGEG